MTLNISFKMLTMAMKYVNIVTTDKNCIILNERMIFMTERVRKYPGMVIVKKETEARLAKLRREIAELESRMERAERRHESNDKVVSLLSIKEDRLRVTEKLLKEIEESTLEIEETLVRVAPDLTPLELMIITKLYIEGMRWNELIDLLQTDPEYTRFCYEKSTYMRAHRSALNKMIR